MKNKMTIREWVCEYDIDEIINEYDWYADATEMDGGVATPIGEWIWTHYAPENSPPWPELIDQSCEMVVSRLWFAEVALVDAMINREVLYNNL